MRSNNLTSVNKHSNRTITVTINRHWQLVAQWTG